MPVNARDLSCPRPVTSFARRSQTCLICTRNSAPGYSLQASWSPTVSEVATGHFSRQAHYPLPPKTFGPCHAPNPYLGNSHISTPDLESPLEPPLKLLLFHRQSCPPKPVGHPLAVLLHLTCQNRPSEITWLVGYVPCKKSTRLRVECSMMNSTVQRRAR
jgi:hypothetical protein